MAAHVELVDGLESAPNAGDITDQPERDELFDPGVVVYDQLSGTSVDEAPDDLLAQAEVHENDGNTISASESRTFAVLLSNLQE